MSLNYNYQNCSAEGRAFLETYAEGRACFYACSTLNAIGVPSVTQKNVSEMERAAV